MVLGTAGKTAVIALNRIEENMSITYAEPPGLEEAIGWERGRAMTNHRAAKPGEFDDLIVQA